MKSMRWNPKGTKVSMFTLQIFPRRLFGTQALENKELGEIRQKLINLYKMLGHLKLQDQSTITAATQFPNIHRPVNQHLFKQLGGKLIDDNKDIDIATVDYETAALATHRGVYLKRPDIRCAAHTHSVHISALSTLEPPHNRGVNRVYYDDHGFDGFVNTSEHTKQMCEYLGNEEKMDIVVMSNHGIVVTGASPELVFDRIVALENSAKLQLLAVSTQQPLRLIDEKVVQKTGKEWRQVEPRYAQAHFNAFLKYMERNKFL
ncbi:ribulose-5-phosphate 4-epimerase-like protein [Reticulomyxa filosa]|uniref:Ribulose-5-phosphate 4-epimerase-like protein n=1 Tax=Reticulomyxa filosa TaxID=46433 RepID=X6N6N6_RETFI|nr:ribulose-5-phosphate 4-epimerase-like protein [Reticulomyxa filosa]|eukprot:ETO21389.1 ribulose-5-phosphate 4-epimerase-like protein [Reticulomyxa filosa]